MTPHVRIHWMGPNQGVHASQSFAVASPVQDARKVIKLPSLPGKYLNCTLVPQKNQPRINRDRPQLAAGVDAVLCSRYAWLKNALISFDRIYLFYIS